MLANRSRDALEAEAAAGEAAAAATAAGSGASSVMNGTAAAAALRSMYEADFVEHDQSTG